VKEKERKETKKIKVRETIEREKREKG